jgi:hypothetical protein
MKSSVLENLTYQTFCFYTCKLFVNASLSDKKLTYQVFINACKFLIHVSFRVSFSLMKKLFILDSIFLEKK